MAIQVKTKSEQSKDFQLKSVTDVSPRNANEWVVLVALHEADPADFFVIPRNHVCATLTAVMHEKPGNTRGSLGPQEFTNYKDTWELMERPAEQADWRLAPWVKDVLDEIQWPHRPR